MGFGFFTNTEIIELADTLFESGFQENNLNGTSYELCLGDEVYISGNNYPDLLSNTNRFINIPSGQFALLITKEYVRLPLNILGLISIKFGKKAQGLVNISGFHVDPGFEGKLVFSVFNAGPSDVVLEYGEPVFMIFFYKLDHNAKPYTGSAQYQKTLPRQIVASLKGTTASLSQVDKRLSRIETTEKLYRGFLIALVVGFITLLVKSFIPS